MKKMLLFVICAATAGITYAQISFTPEAIGASGGQHAVVDMNGDYLDDIVSVTSTNIQVFEQLSAGGFDEQNYTTTPADFPASWSIAAADYDSNGFTDLLYGAGSGVTFMRANATGDGFIEISGSEYVFSQRSNFVDINNDGHLDAFVCHDVEPNVYYINDGSGNLTFIQGGLGDYPTGGNYGSIWIDYDNDGDSDLFIAKCGGPVARRTNELHINNGDGTFTENALDANLADPMQTWSSAWGDYDNDGDMDVFVGASSGPHKFMENNGDGTFIDVTVASNVLSLGSTGIENICVDIDNDGNLDIISHGNILLGNGDLTFSNPIGGELAGNTGSIGDLNDDGFLDAFTGNTIRWNDTNSNNWIKINTIGTVSNLNGIGARVIIETPSGTQIRDVRAGEGFSYASTLNTHFGLGTDSSVSSITVIWPSGIVNVINDPAINSTIAITEEDILDNDDLAQNELVLYPNPASDQLFLSYSDTIENAIYVIYDSNGRRITSKIISENTIDVSGLAAGTYLLRIVDDGALLTQKFVKQ